MSNVKYNIDSQQRMKPAEVIEASTYLAYAGNKVCISADVIASK